MTTITTKPNGQTVIEASFTTRKTKRADGTTKLRIVSDASEIVPKESVKQEDTRSPERKIWDAMLPEKKAQVIREQTQPHLKRFLDKIQFKVELE